jgi:hypothetical protein
VGYRFSLVLNREVTDEETSLLRAEGCAEAVLSSDLLPTNASVTVTKMEFDDTISPSLAEAIESALGAVRKVPDLNAASLTVPAQPATVPVAADGEQSADIAQADTAELVEAAATEVG